MGMPKKNTKKTTRKKNIKTESMPGLIFGEVKTATEESLPKTDKTGPTMEEKFYAHYQNYPTNPTANKWMWGTVVLFALIITTIWGYAMQVKISRTDWEGALKKGIVAKGKNQWDTIFTQTEQQENLKNQITQAITQAALAMTSSTSTNTTTNDLVASSTNINVITTTTVVTATNTEPNQATNKNSKSKIIKN